MAVVDYRSKAANRKAQLGVSIWFKLETGDTEFRIAPTPAGKKSDPVWFERAIHRDVGAKKVSVTCGKHIDADGELQGECYICDKQIPRLEAAGRESRAVMLAPQTQLVIQVYRVNPETGKWEGPFIWTPSTGLGNKLIGLLSSRKRDYADAKKGYNLTINRKGTGKNDTRYGEIEADTDPTALPVEMLKKLKPFDQLVKELRPYSISAQKAAIQGVDLIDEDVDDDLDDDDKPKSAKGGKGAPVAKKKKPPVDEDEEEEGEEEADEDVDEDEDADAEDADEEEADADEEDEDEEPAPKSSKKAAAKPVAKAKAKAKKPPVEEEDEDEEPAEEDEEVDDEEVDEDEEAELEEPEEDEDEEPAPKAKKGAAKKVAPAKVAAKSVKKKPAPVEEEDEEEDIDLEDEDEEEEVTVKLPPKKAATKKRG